LKKANSSSPLEFLNCMVSKSLFKIDLNEAIPSLVNTVLETFENEPSQKSNRVNLVLKPKNTRR